MIVALDLETTGLNSEFDKVIEVAMVKIDENTFEIIEEFSSLVNPMIGIPDLISNITNINDEDVADAPYFSDIQDKIINFIGDSPILGHNVYFDKSFLESHGVDLKNNVCIDTFLFANTFLYNEKSLSLESLSKSLKIKLSGAHRALNDTIATVKLYEKLVSKFDKFPKKRKQFFAYIVSLTDDSGFKYIIDKYVDKELLLSEEDFVKKFMTLFPKVASYEKKVYDKDMKDLDIAKMLSKIEALELRGNQEKMTNIVTEAFKKEKKVLIEAPTGVGKTFAYLLPSIVHSIKTGEQVYISTTTKALQDQIYYKDLEYIKQNFPLDFNYSKLKGKRNYLGINAFLNFLNENQVFSKEKVSFSLKIINWLFESKYGELDELDYYGQEYSFIREVNADDLLTFSSDNSHEDLEFAVRARRQSRQTNIVVINNNILFQDLEGDNNILGKLENLVLDEAHNLEDVITNSYKKGFTMKDLEKSFDSMGKIINKFKKTSSTLHKNAELISFEIATIFDIFGDYLRKNVQNKNSYQICLLKNDFFIDNAHSKDLLNNASIKITTLLDSFSAYSDKLYLALGREMKFLERVLDILSVLFDEDSFKKYISIISYTDHRGLSLDYTLLKPGDYLEKQLWNKLSTCILTSASLKVAGSFNYLNNMLKLDDFESFELETDFDYNKQALLFIPNDIGDIKNNMSKIINFLRKLFLAVRGNTLVLFTAFYSIKQTYTALNRDLKKQDINLYAQSIGGGKQKLITFFKEDSDNSILMGTDTFWEGIDIPGKDLKYLVIHKIPFMVPSDPIFQARSNLFDDAFSEYSIPKSIIKLKQGFGRLIRKKTDSGIVVFLDNRIYSTRWGEVFYSAFPSNINKKHGNAKQLIDILNTGNKK